MGMGGYPVLDRAKALWSEILNRPDVTEFLYFGYITFSRT